MKLLSKKNSLKEINKFAGNKGRSLYILSKNNINIPKWIIIGTDFYNYFFNKLKLNDWIHEQLNKFNPDQVEILSNKITKFILSLASDLEIKSYVDKALSYLKYIPVAVRSSCIEEDSDNLSFAGQFNTYLNVTGLDFTINKILLCWASAYSKRSLLYRWKHKIHIKTTEMAVILQQLIPADKSGVIFTCNPTNGKKDEIVLSSVYGIGEGLVSGTIDADTFVINKKKLLIKNVIIGEKKQQFINNEYIETPEELQKKVSLEINEINNIVKTSKKIEKHYKHPQDIEWCILKNKLWILQSRPITKFIEKCEETDNEQYISIWDNSNIIENFSGITSPLTFSFAKEVYSGTFRQFCKLLPLPKKYIKQIDQFVFSVLGYLNGQVYYNLLNWYKLVALAPFQTLSHKTMEIQMGVTENLDLEKFAEKITPYKPDSKIEYLIIRFLTTLKFIKYYFNLKKNVKNFKETFNKVFLFYKNKNLENIPPNTIFEFYKNFKNNMLEHWGAMIFIESFIGIPYGLIRKLIKAWLPDAPKWLEVSFISGIENLESMKPALDLSKLSDYIKEKPGLKKMIVETENNELYNKLKKSKYHEFAGMIDNYLNEYGYRSNNELKLEEPSFCDEPALLFKLLLNTINNNSNKSLSNINDEDPNELILKKLNFFQKKIFYLIRSMMNNAVRSREIVRLCRTKAFGLVRKMFRAIGDQLYKMSILNDKNDIFYLRTDEIEGCFDGTFLHQELKSLVDKRKKDIKKFETIGNLPARFITKGPIISYFIENEINLQKNNSSDRLNIIGNKFLGTPCSIGSIEGIATVVTEPDEFKEGILVTYRTDPGWVSIFPSAKAIIIERGSPLTHAAIVARELGIPTVIQIPGITKKIKTGMKLRVDGHMGVVEVLE